MPNYKDITGQRFGRLQAIAYDGSHQRRAFWRCRCDCGNEKIVRSKELNNGIIRSCGCLKTPHGQARAGKLTPEWQTWRAMRKRCLDPHMHDFNRYGGRGITICERWLDFQNFLADMGPRPSGHTIERIDNDAGYSPDNCKWTTPSEQAKNRRPRERDRRGRFI